MILGTYTQQPHDTLDYDIPYSLATGDTLSATTCTETAITPVTVPPLVATAGIVGASVKLWVNGGLTANKYKITVKTTTTQGRVKEDEIYIKIKEV